MYKVSIGSLTDRTLIVIMQDADFRAYRAKPLDDLTMIDCTIFGRSDVNIIITYAGGRNPARNFVRERFGIDIVRSPTGNLCFSGKMFNKQVMGVIMTEYTLQKLTRAPLEDSEVFEGTQFGIENFRLMISYADTDRRVVDFLRGLGVTLQQIATDPVLNPLWQQFGREVIDESARQAATAGIEMPTSKDKNYQISVENPNEHGISEQVLLAVRAEEVAWFAVHPNEKEYIRRVRPGELSPTIGAEWVKVIKVGEDSRLRVPLKRVNGELVECHL